MADENLITDDDWAAAMQEQAAVEESGDSEADRVAAELAAAAMGDSPYQARPASQLFEDFGAQGRRVDVDVGRHHLHRIQVEIAPTEQGQDFLGNADAVDEADVDTHGADFDSAMRRVASMPERRWRSKMWELACLR